MEPQNKEEIITNYITAYNNFEIDNMCLYLHDTIEFINIEKGVPNLILNGIHAFKTQAKQAAALFISRQQTIKSTIYADNHVEVEINFTGTLAKDLPNGLKVGNKVEMSGKSIFQFHDGLIIKLVDMS